MTVQRLGDIARLIRSKNAGPFQLTFDVMFEDTARYQQAVRSGAFTAERIGKLYKLAPKDVAIFFCENALAIKVSIPRPYFQGDLRDSDGHGGQQYAPLIELVVGERP